MKHILPYIFIFIILVAGGLYEFLSFGQHPVHAGVDSGLGVYPAPSGTTLAPVQDVIDPNPLGTPAPGGAGDQIVGSGIDCGASGGCNPNTENLVCSGGGIQCGSGQVCTCVSASNGTYSGPTCNGANACGPNPRCPIGTTGYNTCVGSQCIAFCGSSPTQDNVPAPAPGVPPPAPQVFAPLAAGASCDPTLWSGFSPCSGSPAIKTRINQCGGFQSIYCTGTINARAVLGVSGDNCATIQASGAGLDGATFQFTGGSASQPPPLTQSGSSYVTFAGIVGGTYTIVPNAGNYELARACWSKALNAPLSGEGLTTTQSVPFDGDTLTWDVGYIPIAPWVEAAGGNVLVKGAIQSKIPTTTFPRVFVKDGSGGYPGIVSYGTSYDFDYSYLGLGENYVSSKNWLVNQVNTFPDYYRYFYIKLGGPITVDSFPNLTAVPKPASRTKPYYVVGDMTTSGDWTVADGETVMFVVNGNLTINGNINTTGTGFAAFIVKGNITVSSNVGGLYTSSSPQVEGFYVTGPTGIFRTGTSSVVGKERLVLNGTFVAGNFILERDLTGIVANTVSSELFTYDPSLILRMPQALLDVPITWEEVAP